MNNHCSSKCVTETQRTEKQNLTHYILVPAMGRCSFLHTGNGQQCTSRCVHSDMLHRHSCLRKRNYCSNHNPSRSYLDSIDSRLFEPTYLLSNERYLECVCLFHCFVFVCTSWSLWYEYTIKFWRCLIHLTLFWLFSKVTFLPVT